MRRTHPFELLLLAIFAGWQTPALPAGEGGLDALTQAEADAWGEQLFALVVQVSGWPAPEKRPGIVLAQGEQAGELLEAEYARFLPQLQGALPEAKHLGEQALARYLFNRREVLLAPANLALAPGVETLDPAERAKVLKLVLVYALDLALLDAKVPFAPAYYAPGNLDATLAQRAVWEGHARRAQRAAAKELGCREELLDLAIQQSFATQALRREASPEERELRRMQSASIWRLGEVGEAFVRAVLEARGPAGIEQALKAPPFRTSQILSPSDWLDEKKAGRPSAEQLARTLADAAADFFQPDEWRNESHPVGALSLRDWNASKLWAGGAGPRFEVARSFDYDYLAGWALIGNRREGLGQRAASLHAFRSAHAAHRFFIHKAEETRADWFRLAEQQYVFSRREVLAGKQLLIPPSPLGLVDEGLAMLATFSATPAGKSATSNYYLLRKGTWVLELDVDAEPEPKHMELINAAFLKGYQALELTGK
ncbi:MAG: hypothetical protein M5U26_22690 [Planctomycetota bacterium]|nr:hypothetical protein [Planctomycetota bacterium]